MEERSRKLTPALEAEHRHLKRMVDQAQEDVYRGDKKDARQRYHYAYGQLKEFVKRHRLDGFEI